MQNGVDVVLINVECVSDTIALLLTQLSRSDMLMTCNQPYCNE